MLKSYRCIISNQLLHSNSKDGTMCTVNDDELLTSAITILLAVIAIVPVARVFGLLIVNH